MAQNIQAPLTDLGLRPPVAADVHPLKKSTKTSAFNSRLVHSCKCQVNIRVAHRCDYDLKSVLQIKQIVHRRAVTRMRRHFRRYVIFVKHSILC